MADAFEALIEMWNIENKKGKIDSDMSSPFVTGRRSNTLYNGNNLHKSKKIRHNSFDLGEKKNGDRPFRLNNRRRNKKCAC